MIEQRTPLTEAPRKLGQLYDRPVPDRAHRRLWQAVVDGKLPAVRTARGWAVRDEDLPRAAALLGMAVPANAA